MKNIFLIIGLVVTSSQISSAMETSLPLMEKLCNALYTEKNNKVREILNDNPELLTTYHTHTNKCKIFNAQYRRIYSLYCFDGVMPLHSAVMANNYVGTQLLLHEYKANPNVKTFCAPDRNATPLHVSQNSTLTHLLMVFDAKVDELDFYGNTPLYISLFNPYVYPNIRVAEALVKYGQANVNNTTPEGETLLHEALRYKTNTIDIVRFLLRYGANKNLPNGRAKTPLQNAIQLHNGYEELLDLLR